MATISMIFPRIDLPNFVQFKHANYNSPPEKNDFLELFHLSMEWTPLGAVLFSGESV